MKKATFWDIMPCSMAAVYRRFRGMCCLHLQGRTVKVCQTTQRHIKKKTLLIIAKAVGTADLTIYSSVYFLYSRERASDIHCTRMGPELGFEHGSPAKLPSKGLSQQQKCVDWSVSSGKGERWRTEERRALHWRAFTPVTEPLCSV
jgi:hypothetical protein